MNLANSLSLVDETAGLPEIIFWWFGIFFKTERSDERRSHMESYILRLYRRGNGDKDKVAGLLEGVDRGTRSSFRSFEELRRLILSEAAEEINSSQKNGNFKTD